MLKRNPFVSSRVMQDGTLACSALLDLCKVVLANGTTEQQHALVRIATNSLQCEFASSLARSRDELGHVVGEQRQSVLNSVMVVRQDHHLLRRAARNTCTDRLGAASR